VLPVLVGFLHAYRMKSGKTSATFMGSWLPFFGKGLHSLAAVRRALPEKPTTINSALRQGAGRINRISVSRPSRESRHPNPV
jgi:hypothetical protein